MVASQGRASQRDLHISAAHRVEGAGGQVAEVDDEVGRQRTHVSQYGFQGEQVAVNVSEDGNAHQNGFQQERDTVLPEPSAREVGLQSRLSGKIGTPHVMSTFLASGRTDALAMTRLVAGLATSPSLERYFVWAGRLALGVCPTLDVQPILKSPMRRRNPADHGAETSAQGQKRSGRPNLQMTAVSEADRPLSSKPGRDAVIAISEVR